MLPLYEIESLEDAFLNVLAPLRASGAVRTLESYGGQLEEDEIAKVTARFPAAYVIWGGSEVLHLNKVDEIHVRVSIFAADKNLRGEAAARRGASESSGAYALLSGVRNLLHRTKVRPEFTPALLVSERPLIFDSRIVVYEAVYEMKARF